MKIFFLLFFLSWEFGFGSETKQSCTGDNVCGDGYCCKYSSACYCSHLACREGCMHGDQISSGPGIYGLPFHQYDDHHAPLYHEEHHSSIYHEDQFSHDVHHDEFHNEDPSEEVKKKKSTIIIKKR